MHINADNITANDQTITRSEPNPNVSYTIKIEPTKKKSKHDRNKTSENTKDLTESTDKLVQPKKKEKKEKKKTQNKESEDKKKSKDTHHHHHHHHNNKGNGKEKTTKKKEREESNSDSSDFVASDNEEGTADQLALTPNLKRAMESIKRVSKQYSSSSDDDDNTILDAGSDDEDEKHHKSHKSKSKTKKVKKYITLLTRIFRVITKAKEPKRKKQAINAMKMRTNLITTTNQKQPYQDAHKRKQRDKSSLDHNMHNS